MLRQCGAATRRLGHHKQAKNTSYNDASEQNPKEQSHGDNQEKRLMIISNVRVEVGALEVKIVAPGALVPLVAQVNPST